MDTVGLLGKVLERARENDQAGVRHGRDYVHSEVADLARRVGLTEADLDDVERYAEEMGMGAVVYYP